MTVPSLTQAYGHMSPAGAVASYARVDSGAGDPLSAAGGGEGGEFGAALTRALGGVVDAGHAADATSMQAIAGNGNLTDVVTAVSRAELALQTTVAIRDRVVQAYQDIMRMAI